MRAIVTVIGKDKVGIIAKVSAYLTGINVNIEDISQTVLQEYFVMMMLVDISGSDRKIGTIQEGLNELGSDVGLSLRIQHEDIFNIMHKV